MIIGEIDAGEEPLRPEGGALEMLDEPLEAHKPKGEVALGGAVVVAEPEPHSVGSPNGKVHDDADPTDEGKDPEGIVFDKRQEKWLGGIFDENQIEEIKGLKPDAQDAVVEGLLLHYGTLTKQGRTAEVIERNSEVVRLFLHGSTTHEIADEQGRAYGNVTAALRNIPSYIAESLPKSRLQFMLEAIKNGDGNEGKKRPEANELAARPTIADYQTYYGIEPPMQHTEGDQDKTRRQAKQTLVFQFNVGGKSISARFYNGRGFNNVTLQEKILLGVGHSDTVIQPAQQQRDQIRKIAAKQDGDEATFDSRFKKELEKEIKEGRVTVGDDERLHLDVPSLDILEAALGRIKNSRGPKR